MKARLTLNNPLWKTPERRSILDKAVQQSAAELESLIKQKVLTSVPAGKVYRRGSITTGPSNKNPVLGLRRAGNRSNKVIIGSSFHRASAKGQPFANDTGGTLNATRAKKTGELKATVTNSKKYAEILDNPNKLDRPFFASTAEEFKAKFKQNLATAIKENL